MLFNVPAGIVWLGFPETVNSARFRRMLELTVAALRFDLGPSVVAEPPEHLAYLHGVRPSEREAFAQGGAPSRDGFRRLTTELSGLARRGKLWHD
jgi:hypothetical protein